jgi:hypothetical protein
MWLPVMVAATYAHEVRGAARDGGWRSTGTAYRTTTDGSDTNGRPMSNSPQTTGTRRTEERYG